LYHPSFFFSLDDLHSLAHSYPQELVSFIVSLRLIRNHDCLLSDYGQSNGVRKVTRKAKLDPDDRFAVTAIENPAEYFSTAWAATLRLIHRSYLSRILLYLGIYSESFLQRTEGVSDGAESVTSLMLPMMNTGSIETLALFVQVCDQLDSVELFDCPMGTYSLAYFWNMHGRETHLEGLFRYLAAGSIFILSLFAPMFKQYSSVTTSGYHVGIGVLNAVVIALFAYYLYDEFGQCRAKFSQMEESSQRITQKKQKQQKTRNFGGFVLNHFLGNLWNAIDLAIVVTGIAGLISRFVHLKDTEAGRVLFAITSVLVWIKVLYFMRPFATSGPLGKGLKNISPCWF
jgi:hypothetical protein